MKEDKGSLTIRINGGGPIGSVVAVSDSGGNVRGYVENPFVELPLRSDGKLNVGGAVGRDGMVTVSGDSGLKEPYIRSPALISGEIAEDMTAYLTESEQVPSACALGVLVDTDRSIKAAGGFIVQLMPGADSALIDKLEENIFMMDQLTTILDEDGAEAVFEQVLKGLEHHIVGEKEIEYRCYCSHDRVKDALRSIGREELGHIAEEGKDISVSCQFCDKVYSFTPAEITALAGEELT
jgi:molecular chaperone Hsp33